MPTGYAVTGIIGIPAAFVLLGSILLVFCVGYNAMSRRISNAGAFYAYIAQGVSRPAGVAAAWVAHVLATTCCRSACTGSSARRPLRC